MMWRAAWEGTGARDRTLLLALVVRELLKAQRRAIVRLRNQGAISNGVIHRIERELDLEDTRLDIGPRRWAACA